MSRQPGGLDIAPIGIRSSQRAPKSCARCAKKRIKCDKNIPCQTCIARGLEVTCKRETVRVKGRVVAGSPSEDGGPTYSDLLEENRRLKSALGKPDSVCAEQNASTWPHGEFPTITEAFENDVHPATLNAKESSTVRSRSDILLPSERCSSFLFEHGVIWTSWIHFAIHVPTFRLEHSEYWAQSFDTPILQRDPFWLAIYFSFLSVTLIFLDEHETAAAGLPHSDIVALLENWYDASIFFLEQAEYLRRHDMRTVQTIAILLGLYKNMGDFGLHTTHLAAAIRIAQTLRLDQDNHNAAGTLLHNEARRRVWWTLVICEWLQKPIGVFLVREFEFDVAIPLDIDDEELAWQSLHASCQPRNPSRPRPIQYHLAMIAVATLWYRFRSSLVKVRHDPELVESLVLHSDEALANIINELPSHLQQDSTTFTGPDDPPWIPWQRNTLSMSLLYYRMGINRVLQDQWVQSPNAYARTQEICLGSAQAIIALADREQTASARNRPWAIASTLFSAAITLSIEARFSESGVAAAYIENVRRCIVFLSEIKDRNAVAARAIEVLNNCLAAPDLTTPFAFP